MAPLVNAPSPVCRQRRGPRCETGGRGHRRRRLPVRGAQARAIAPNLCAEEIEAALSAEIKAIVDDATDFAEAEPDPQPSTAMRWAYAEDWPSETPPPWGFGEGSAEGGAAEGGAAEGGD